ncbi:MAG: M48 family metalloprotease [Verrucomicrobiae bacterium]|nr:M48 family metalloprotease [Verrucomicrobiae bacterium]
MNPFLDLLQNPAASRLGATLLHFIWQGAALAALLAVALRGTRRQSARLRYALSCATLAAMATVPLITLLLGDGALVADDPVQGGAGIRALAAGSGGGMTSVIGLGPISRGWLPWVTLAWLAGVVLLGGRLAGGCWHVQRLRCRETRPIESPWPERLSDLQRRMGIGTGVDLLESGRIRAPMIIGWMRPVILLPVGFVAGMSPVQVDAILAHELAHLQRRDYLVNLLQRVVETLLFYHPAVWWVSEQIRIEREFCCDDLAAAVIGDRTQLAGALVALAEQEATDPGFAFAADGGSVSQRVGRLLGVPAGASSSGRIRRLGMGIVLAVAVLAGTWVGLRWTAPMLYVSTAIIKVESPGGNDPYLLQTAMEWLRSATVLDATASNLGLVNNRDDPDSRRQQVREQLRERIRVVQFRNTSLLRVSAASEDQTRAADIANNLVHEFMALKANQRRELMDLPRRTLLQKVNRCELRLADLVSRQTEILQETAANPGVTPPDYYVVKKNLEIYNDLLTRLRTQLAEADVGAVEIEWSSPVEILEPASPSLRRAPWRN